MSDSQTRTPDSGTVSRPPATWKRRKWVIDPHLQYTLIACSGFFAFSVLVLFYTMSARSSSHFLEMASKLSIADRDRLLFHYSESVDQFRKGLLLGFIGFSALFSYFVLKLSNRIAGPLFNLRRVMRLSRETGKLEPVRFRKGDFIQDLAEEYNSLVKQFGGAPEGALEKQPEPGSDEESEGAQ